MIALVGLNHKSAPLEIREKFVFSEPEIFDFAELFQAEDYFKGIVVLSTCNRTEFYIESENIEITRLNSDIFRKLSLYRNTSEEIEKYFYINYGKEAVNHLFKVGCGLDSMVLGEYQIVGQLKEAYRISEKNQILGCELQKLFQKAFEAGKKVRTQTKINEGAVTVSYAAVETAFRFHKHLENKNILCIGAGETGQLVLSSLMKKNCKKVTIANRTYSKALEVARHFNAEAIELEEADKRILEFDIILVSTASQTPLITASRIEKLMHKRHEKPLLLVDLSVPRNIEKEVAQIPGVNLFDVDSLQEVVNENYEKRKGVIVHSQEIIDVSGQEFMDWLSSRQLGHTFNKIYENFKQINQKEIDGFQKNRAVIDYSKAVEYGDHITDKYIRLLIKNIKSVTDNGKKTEYIKLVNELFELA